LITCNIGPEQKKFWVGQLTINCFGILEQGLDRLVVSYSSNNFFGLDVLKPCVLLKTKINELGIKICFRRACLLKQG